MRSHPIEQSETGKTKHILDKPLYRFEKCHWVEPWYLSYAILGCTMGGMFPILTPLLALKRFSSACHVGLFMAAFNFGVLLSPIWGRVADRYGIHRALLYSGLIMIAIALAMLTFADTFAVWLGLALIQGIGAFLIMTLGNLFIVEIHPKTEWNERIGWLQTFNSGGQVSGMLLAAALSQFDLSFSLLIAASLIAFAVLPSCLTPTILPQMTGLKSERFRHDSHFHWNQKSLHWDYRHIKLNFLRHFKTFHNTSFERFMGVWFLCATGTSAIYTLYPVIMQEVYGISQKLLSLTFALSMGLSVFLYTQAGRLTSRFSTMRILQNFLGLRFLAFLGFFLLGVLYLDLSPYLVLLSFSIIVLCWPFLIVSSTALTASLSPFGEGEGMGFFYSVLAMACVVGSALGGWLAEKWGYNAVSGMVVITEALGIISIYKIRKTTNRI